MKLAKVIKTVKLKYVLVALFVVASMVVLLTSPVAMAAENVVIVDSDIDELTLLPLDGTNSTTGHPWDLKGSYTYANGVHTLKSNGYNQWYDADHMHMAYKKIPFNYGSKGILTITVDLTGCDFKDDNSQAGLMLRGGNSPSSSTVFIHMRPSDRVVASYRTTTGLLSNYLQSSTKTAYPCALKIELQKNAARCYYKPVGSNSWVKVLTASISYEGVIYAGIASASLDQNFISTATFENLHYTIEAPEGTVPNPDVGEEPPGDDIPSEEEIVLPEDLPVTENTLLSETFTDGSMTEGPQSVTNPIWKNQFNSKADIELNAEKTNRYLSIFDEDIAFRAGDEGWTDYSYSMEITFNDDTNPLALNQVALYTRLTSIYQYGFHGYAVVLYNGEKLQIKKLSSTNTLNTGSITLEEVPLDYLSDIGVTHKIRITAFDDTITVYWDGEEIASAKDETGLVRPEGCIGMGFLGASVYIDNIKVTKLDDLLGGDYDNQIGGLWNEPIPDVVAHFKENDYLYK